MPHVFDSTGREIRLQTQIGSGGEGDVFHLADSPNFAAKVYHRTPDLDKQEKLRAMVRGCDEAPKCVAAWPVATLHKRKGGPVDGFLMPKVSGFKAVHKLYGPAHRKLEFERADWAFLIHTARNLAAAFDAVHAHGHVIGDVNQGNVLVGPKATVCLIDCDSFQIRLGERDFLCEVGVPHFTPPELQRVHNFRTVQRSHNHDRFGLAVLCFHLLFMGRHPFAGVYAGPGFLSIEDAIASFSFAFGRHAAAKRITPPPNCVTPEIVPAYVSELFERAFGETSAAPAGRPVAREWVAALEQLERSLRTCPQDPSHKFVNGLAVCPWCRLETTAAVVFFVSTAPLSTFDSAALWRQIRQTQEPVFQELAEPSAQGARPAPLPSDVQAGRSAAVVRKVLAVVIVIAALAFPPALCPAAIVALLLFCWGYDDGPERRRREAALRNAQSNWQSVARRWSQETGPSRFREKLAELQKAQEQYDRLDVELAAERQSLLAESRERQLHWFLDRFCIDDHKITNIGPTRKATLASFGIETAADVSRDAILKIPGFGGVLTQELIRWRQRLEMRFQFNPNQGVDRRDIEALNTRFRQRRTQLQAGLLLGPEELRQRQHEAPARRSQLQPEVVAAAAALAQAKADMSVL